jgi:hypothetical protein
MGIVVEARRLQGTRNRGIAGLGIVEARDQPSQAGARGLGQIRRIGLGRRDLAGRLAAAQPPKPCFTSPSLGGSPVL